MSKVLYKDIIKDKLYKTINKLKESENHALILVVMKDIINETCDKHKELYNCDCFEHIRIKQK